MKKFTKTVIALSVVGCAAINSPTVAEAENDAGWYVGGSVGQSRAKINDAQITRNLLGAGITTNSITNDNRDTAYKVFAGYQYNNYLSFEGGYFDLGKFGYTAVTAAPNAGIMTGKLKLRGLNFDVVGNLPMTDKLSVLGRLGGTYAQTKDNFRATGNLTVANPNPQKTAWNYKIGTGLEYDVITALSLRVEAERYRINDALGNRGDIDLFSAGLVYRFGKEAEPMLHASVAEPVHQPVIETPVAVADKVVLTPKEEPLIKEALNTDSLFVFDSTKINPTGKQGLDKLVVELKHNNFDMIYVTGYTDRIGTHDYNMKLSAARAKMVKTYLVNTAGVPSDKIQTKGLGEAKPVTKPGTCKGTITEQTTKVNAKKLKACLAPDRRVEVEVIATQKPYLQ